MNVFYESSFIQILIRNKHHPLHIHIFNNIQQ